MLQPLNDKVIVRRDEADDKTPGGIIMPDTAKEKPQRGRVIAVGPGKWNEAGTVRLAMNVGAGQAILFSRYGGSEIDQDGKTLLIISQDDILAIVKE
jgi:chaperonin GroES